MNPEEQTDFLEQQRKEIEAARANININEANQTQQAIALESNENNIVKEQLDTSEDLQKIYNLLNGYSLERDDKTGAMVWTAPENNDMIILTKYGIQFVMGKLITYLSKNTLLSNYNDKQIEEKMEDISNNINDTVFMEYDKMFLYPTLEDCKTELKNRIKNKIDIRKFAIELMGKEVDSEKQKEIEENILQEMESKIEREMGVIKEQKMKSKLKRYESIVRDIQDTIHSAYQRAWKGQERTTLRQHIHISESRGGNQYTPPPQPSRINPLNWLKPR